MNWFATMTILSAVAANPTDQYPTPSGPAAELRRTLDAVRGAVKEPLRDRTEQVRQALRGLSPHMPVYQKLSWINNAGDASEVDQEAFGRSLAEAVEMLSFAPLKEADLPRGFPTYTPVGFIEVKSFPTYRIARGTGFFPLFLHIQRNGIAMTAPVEMEYSVDAEGVPPNRPPRRSEVSSRRDPAEPATSPSQPSAAEFFELTAASPEELSTIIVDVLLIQVTPHAKNHQGDEADPAEEKEAAQMPVVGVLKKSISELIRKAPKTGEQDSALADWLSTSEELGRHQVTRYRLSAVNKQAVLQQFGQLIPTVQSSQLTQFGTVRNTTMQQVGTLLRMTPVVLSDGALMIDLQLEHSALGAEDEGTVISENNGEQVRQPVVNTVTVTSRIRARQHEPVIACDRVVTSPSGTKRFAVILAAHVQHEDDEDVTTP